jgi:hypothetical protein
METAIKEEREGAVQEEKKGKRKWGKFIFNFLIYGGWLLVIVVILGVVVLISVLSS